MISHQLRKFVDRAMGRGMIDSEDLKVLRDEIFADTVMTREAIDVLVALDRAVKSESSDFADWLVALVVDFAVWESRPTGLIDREKAHWLLATLNGAGEPTATARRIAFEIVREAQSCDELLLGFALGKGDAASRGVVVPAERLRLAS